MFCTVFNLQPASRSLFRLDGDLAGVFEDRPLDFLHAGAPCGSQSDVEFMMGDLFSFHDVGEQFAVVNQYFRAAFNQAFQPFALVGHTANDSVGDNQRGGGDESARDRIIATVHGVLDGVAQH